MDFPINWETDEADSMAVGDVNGDGVADIVVGMFSGNVAVYINRGDGRFRARRNYQATEDASSVAIGDLNGDGKPDLVVGDDVGYVGSVAVLLNRGDGTFGQSHLYRVGADPAAVAMGDLDGDGNPDLVAANDEDDSVSVLKNRGDGTFEPARSYRTDPGPQAVALGDLTGDGKLDVVTGNPENIDSAVSTVSLLANNGHGTFASRRTYRLREYDPQTMQIADLDGDGKPELIVSALGSKVDKIFVFHNEGGGILDRPRKYTTLEGSDSGLVGLAVGDLNGDGSPDLATAFVSVYLNRGDGTFSRPETFDPARGLDLGHDYVAIAKLTADKRSDVAIDGAVLANATDR